MSSLWKELGAESFIKGVEYHRKRRQPLPERFREEVLAIIPIDAGMREAFRRALDAADSGDETELNQLTARGTWALFLDGFNKGRPVDEYPYSNRYILALETAFVEPVRLIEQGDFAGAVRALASEGLTRQLLSPDMSDALAAVTSKERVWAVEWAITLETALSHLAAWNASLNGKSSAESVLDITPLFGSGAGRLSVPGREFYRFLMSAAKQRSMGALLEHLSDGRGFPRVDIDVQTLKRWSAGKTLPELGRVKLIARKCCPDQEERLLNMHWAMRYLTLLGHVSEVILLEIAQHTSELGTQELFVPWPTFPFGCENFQAWCRKRYPFWYQYHQGQLAAEREACTAWPPRVG